MYISNESIFCTFENLVCTPCYRFLHTKTWSSIIRLQSLLILRISSDNPLLQPTAISNCDNQKDIFGFSSSGISVITGGKRFDYSLRFSDPKEILDALHNYGVSIQTICISHCLSESMFQKVLSSSLNLYYTNVLHDVIKHHLNGCTGRMDAFEKLNDLFTNKLEASPMSIVQGATNEVYVSLLSQSCRVYTTRMFLGLYYETRMAYVIDKTLYPLAPEKKMITSTNSLIYPIYIMSKSEQLARLKRVHNRLVTKSLMSTAMPLLNIPKDTVLIKLFVIPIKKFKNLVKKMKVEQLIFLHSLHKNDNLVIKVEALEQLLFDYSKSPKFNTQPQPAVHHFVNNY